MCCLSIYRMEAGFDTCHGIHNWTHNYPALASLNIISINVNLVEFLIPLTIFITAVANMASKQIEFSGKLHRFKYLTAMILD